MPSAFAAPKSRGQALRVLFELFEETAPMLDCNFVHSGQIIIKINPPHGQGPMSSARTSNPRLRMKASPGGLFRRTRKALAGLALRMRDQGN